MIHSFRQQLRRLASGTLFRFSEFSLGWLIWKIHLSIRIEHAIFIRGNRNIEMKHKPYSVYLSQCVGDYWVLSSLSVIALRWIQEDDCREIFISFISAASWIHFRRISSGISKNLLQTENCLRINMHFEIISIKKLNKFGYYHFYP